MVAGAQSSKGMVAVSARNEAVGKTKTAGFLESIPTPRFARVVRHSTDSSQTRDAELDPWLDESPSGSAIRENAQLFRNDAESVFGNRLRLELR